MVIGSTAHGRLTARIINLRSGSLARMKKCPRCGTTHPDDAEVCAVDGAPLQSDNPAAESDSADAGTHSSQPVQADDGVEAPEGFRPFGCFDPLAASELLRQFEEAGIQFLIDRVERSIETGRGIRKEHLVQIHVHCNDGKRAFEILSADWKV